MESMNITNAIYNVKIAPDGTEVDRNIKAVIDGVEMFVPLSQGNRHYAEIMRQVEAGELVIQPADEPE